MRAVWTAPSLSQSPRATMTPRTTGADPEAVPGRSESLSCEGWRAWDGSPGTEIEMTMTDSTQPRHRELQQDARAWSTFTSTNYTAALRQMRSPLAQGLLGDRLSARSLIATLSQHELVGTRGGSPRLGENGFSDSSWHFNGETDYVELALIADMLRMFGPLAGSETPDVSSYSLKHTAETFLSPHCSYVSNGRLIWAAATLGFPIAEQSGSRLNLLIGVPEREHEYIRQMLDRGQTPSQAHHYRPPGLEHLRAALDRIAAGDPLGEGWVRPAPTSETAPFHDWLIQQTGRPDSIGTLATDYLAGVRDSDHQLAHTPDDLLAVLQRISRSVEAYNAVVTAITEWMTTSSQAQPIRTE